MEKEFTEWFEANKNRFAHGQFDEKQIAYSAWLEGQKQALRIHDVVGRSEQLACDGCGESVRVNKKGDWIICSECGYQKEAN